MSGIKLRRAAAAAADSVVYVERKEAIRAAAGAVFQDKGFHATKLSDVAERAGMDRASLYYYVGSKEDLFRDVVAEAVAVNLSDARRISESEGLPREKLGELVKHLMITFEVHYPFLQVFVQENTFKLGIGRTAEAWAPILRQAERYFEIVTEIVSEGLDSGDLKSHLPPGVIAKAIIGMINSLHSWYRPDGALGGAEVGEGMAKILLNGLQARRRQVVSMVD